jgi:putative membrane protein
MIFEIIIATLIGILFGIFTGLVPGIHLNLISILILSFSAFLLQHTTPLTLAAFIVSMAITHTFLNVLPAIFLGVPESGDNALSVLPGHKMLLEGKGYEAVLLTVVGSFLAIIIGIILTPLILKILPIIYETIKEYIGYILLLTSIFLIYREKQKHLALIIFLMSGTLGIITLNLNMTNPLFPLLSSLFGTAGLIISLKDNVKIPEQIIEKINLPKLETIKAIASASIVGTFTTMMPGLGPAQAAIIGSQITKLSSRGFLILVGALDTLGMVMSFIAYSSIDKARNGAVIVIGKLLETITPKELYLFLGIALVTGIIAIFLTLKLTKLFSIVITKINYQKLNIGIIILIILMTIFLSGPLGLLILAVGSFLGMLPPLLNIGRNHLMGCLMIPVILFFLL